MNRSDLKEYFRSLKQGQQNKFVGISKSNHKKPQALLREASYENPVTEKEKQLAQMAAHYWAEDMKDLYPDIPQDHVDAAEEELYSALIDIGEFYGKENMPENAASYKRLLEDLEVKLVGKGYATSGSGAFDEDVPGYGDLEDEYSPDYMGEPDDASIEDLAAADRVMGNPDQALMKDPAYKSSFEDDDPLRAMGFSDYQSNNPEDEGYSEEYEEMIRKGKIYDK